MKPRNLIATLPTLLFLCVAVFPLLGAGPDMIHNGTLQDPLNANGYALTNVASVIAPNGLPLPPAGNGSALTGINTYVSPIAISSTTPTTLTRSGPLTTYLLNLSATGSAYVAPVVLSTTGAVSGDKIDVTLAFPVSTTPPSVQLLNGSTSGTLLLTSPTSGLAAFSHTLHFNYTGTSWTLSPDGSVLMKSLGSGVASSLNIPVDGGGYNIPTEDIHGDLLYPFGGGTTYLTDNTGGLYYGSGALLADHNGKLYSPSVTSGKFLLSGGTAAITGASPNAASGPVVTDVNNNIPYDPHTANLDNTYDVFEGDSITYGANLSAGQSFPAVFATLSYAKNHSTIIDDGVISSVIPAGGGGGQTATGTWASGSFTITLTTVPTAPSGPMLVSGAGIPYGTTGTIFSTTLTLSQKTFAAGSSATVTLGGNNATDRFPSQVSPYRPWANAGSTAGTGTITGDGNVTLTFSSTQVATSICPIVGGTLYFNGHLVHIATMPTSTTATIATSVPAGSGMATSLVGINPSAASFTFGGNGGTRSILHVMLGINDSAQTGATTSGVIGYLSAYDAMALSLGFTVIQSTILPTGPPSNYGNETIREGVNAAIRGYQIPCNYVADSELVLSDPTNTTYFQSDGTHPTAAGAKALAFYYNIGMTANGFFPHVSEGTISTPVVAREGITTTTLTSGTVAVTNLGGTIYLGQSNTGNIIAPGTIQGNSVNGTGPVYYTFSSVQGIGVAGSGSSYDEEFFNISGCGFSWNSNSYQGTDSTSQLMHLSPTGALSVPAGTITEGTGATANVLQPKITGTLSGGTVTITNAAILTSSFVQAAHMATSTSNAGSLYVSALSAGSVTIKSSNAADNDTIVLTVQ